MNTSSRRVLTRAERARLRAGIATAFAALALSACGGGGGGASPTPPPPPGSPSLAVAAAAASAVSGGSAVALHATLTDGAGATSWALDGPGSLSATSGADVGYLPPDLESLDAAATATITATADGVSTSTQIALTPSVVAGHHWTLSRDATPIWNTVVDAHGLFVALGADGALATSPDGTTWTRRDTGTQHDWIAAAWGDAAGWVAVSQNNGVATSPDGVTWTVQADMTPPAGQAATLVNSVVYGNGVYLATGWAATYTSTDGKAWTLQPLLYWAAFGNGQFLAGSGSAAVSSTDGVHWTSIGVDPDQSIGPDAVFGNGVFVVGRGTTYSSSADGIHWTNANTAMDDFGRLVFSGGLFRTGAGVASADGVTWTSEGAGLPAPTSLAFNDDASVVAAIDFGTQSLESGPSLSTLTAMAPPAAISYHAIDYVGSKFVRVSDNNIETSSDGVAWTTGASVMLGSPGGGWTSLAHGSDGSILLAGYLNPATVNSHGVQRPQVPSFHVVSADGAEVVNYSYAPPTVRTEGDDIAVQVARDAQGWVYASRNGEIGTSPDGATWTAKSLAAASLDATIALGGLAYGNGRYVVAGGGGYAAWSTDAVTWKVAPTVVAPGPSATPVDMGHVLFDGKRFIAVGGRGVIATSADGSTWTAVQTPVQATLQDIARAADGELIAVGADGATVSSVDAVHWTARAALSSHTLTGVAAGPGGFVAVGLYGLQQQSTH